jgi:hypothetical protein
MIAAALRAEIEQYAARMRRSNRLYLGAESGSLVAAQVAAYLANIHHLLLYTPVYLRRARERAAALQQTALAEHYDQKFSEETGHDAWAERDIERVSGHASISARREVVPSMQELLTFIASIIDEDPALYLSYILFAEQLVVILGPEWLQFLEERCNIPRSSMTVIGNHVELDREHVEQALDTIDDLVADPRKLPRMRAVLLETMASFDRFCIEITQERPYDSRASQQPAPHVSAA